MLVPQKISLIDDGDKHVDGDKCMDGEGMHLKHEANTWPYT